MAPFDDENALDAFAQAVDVATLEFENVPIASLERIAANTPVFPSPDVQAVAQNRLREKDFANANGITTAPYRGGRGDPADELRTAVAEIGTPSVLKTVRFRL